jgi:glycosyltransferase involved in cell wall biosynthesis
VAGADAGKVVVFTGAMDYWPNEDAVCWFADEVLPLIHRQAPGVCFHIVGARPSPRVRKLAQRGGVVVEGEVKDMRPYLAHAAVAVAPLRIARGVQNKVLEAMSMATAAVVTAEGLDGIDAKPGRQLALAADAGSFAAAVLRLLDPAESQPLGAEARQLMQQRYAWKRNLQRLQRLLDGESVDIQTGDLDIGELPATEFTVS